MTKHLSPEVLNARRQKAVILRLDGLTVATVSQKTGLSPPTVSAAWKAFREGGWAAVPVQPRGRHKGQANVLADKVKASLWAALYREPPNDAPGWSSKALAERVAREHNVTLTQRAVEHWWADEGLKTAPWSLTQFAKERSPRGRWYRQSVAPVVERAKEAAQRWQGGVRRVAQQPLYQLYVHGSRGRLWMRCFNAPPRAADYMVLFERLLAQAPGKSVALVFHGAHFDAAPDIGQWLDAHPALRLVPVPANTAISA